VTQLSGPSPSIQLFERSCTVTVGTTQIANVGQKTSLHVWFQVRRSLKPRDPNTCDLRIWNLSDTTRKAIEQAAQPLPPPGGSPPGAPLKATPVRIDAGYVGNTSTIFLGELRSAQTVRDGPSDTVTELTTGDGDDAAILSRSSAALGAGTTAYLVAQQLLGDMGCGVGNIATVRSVLQASTAYPKGVALKGASFDLLCDLAASCGLEVTIQGGVAQWLSRGRPLGGQAYLLQTTPQNTGVIGEPTVDTKGVLSIQTLMLPGLAPGQPVSVSTAYISGLYRVVSFETTGDSAGDDWTHSLECKRYGLAA
jgi:hypothetical protein